MIIRPATIDDLEIIADYNVRLAQESEDLRLIPATVHKGVAALLRDPAKGIYYVAEDEVSHELLGQLMITYEWSDWRNGMIWWIQSVYVRASARGQGIFKALFENLERLAREQKSVCTLRLYMDKHNEKARRAYGKMGLRETNYQVFELDLED